MKANESDLPRSFVFLSWTMVIVAALYWIYHQSLGAGQGPMARYTDARLALMDQGGPVTDAELTKLASDPMVVSAGKTEFARMCVECHLERGQGKTGPNLTDEYWLYGAAPADIYQTIFLGKTGKGMPEWGAALGKLKVKQLTAFVLSIQNSKVPGKAPQGERVTPQTSRPPAAP